MFISQKLKSELEQSATQWIKEHYDDFNNSLKYEDYDTIKRRFPENNNELSFNINTKNDVGILFILLSDKLRAIHEECNPEAILKPYKPGFFNGGYYRLPTTNGYYNEPVFVHFKIEEEDRLMEKLTRTYDVPKSFLGELHSFALLKYLIDTNRPPGQGGDRETRMKLWNELWKELLNKYQRLTEENEQRYSRAREEKLQKIRNWRKIASPTPLQLAELICNVDGVSFNALKKEIASRLCFTSNNNDYYSFSELREQSQQEIWDYIYDDYVTSAQAKNHRVMQKEECLRDSNELRSYITGFRELREEEVDKRQKTLFDMSRTANQGSIRHVMDILNQYVIKPDACSLKVLSKLFSPYIAHIGNKGDLVWRDDNAAEPNNNTKNALALFLGYPSWQKYVQGTGYDENNNIIENTNAHSDFADCGLLSDFFDGLTEYQIIRIELAKKKEEIGVEGLIVPTYFYLRMIDVENREGTVVHIDGHIDGMKEGDDITIIDMGFGRPMRFSNDDDENYMMDDICTIDVVEDIQSNVVHVKGTDDYCVDDDPIGHINLLRMAVESKIYQIEPTINFDGDKVSGFRVHNALLKEQINIPRNSLQRFWDAPERVPQIATLDDLSRFVGFVSYSDFVLKSIEHAQEQIYKAYRINDFVAGDRLEIRYAPGHILTGTFVDSSDNVLSLRIDKMQYSYKLKAGDLCQIDTLQVGYDLYLYHLLRDGNEIAPCYTSETIQSIKKWVDDKWELLP